MTLANNTTNDVEMIIKKTMCKEKKCSICKEEKTLENFYTNNSHKDKKSYYCIPCAKKKSRHYNLTYKFQRKEASKESKEKQRLYMMEYRKRKLIEDAEGWRKKQREANKRYREGLKAMENERNITSNI